MATVAYNLTLNKVKLKYRGMFETQKSGKKTSSGMNGLKIKNSEHVAGLFYFIPL